MRALTLGPFDLEDRLGVGGMGEVWRGRHRAQGVEVAVKVITAAHARSRQNREALENEVRAVAALDHPGIVHIFDQGDVSQAAAEASEGRLIAGSPFLAMECAEGPLQVEEVADWAQARALLDSLLAALAHAHARGVVHRDLKPANFLRFGDGRVAIADFGLAHAVDRTPGAADAFGGTPAYMAPEQVKGRWRDFGPWTDLYSMGCVAWALISGAPPFEGSVRALGQAHLYAEPPTLAPRMAVPAGLEAWLLRLLRKEPVDRFRCAADARFSLASLGAPVGGVSSTSARSSSSMDSRTLSFDDLPDEPLADLPREPTAEVQRPAALRARPPLPDRVDARATRPSMALVGAGLGLWGLRAVPLTGRAHERDALWRALTDVHRHGGARSVVLTGPPGIGKSRLARWIAQRAFESGLAAPFFASADARAPGAAVPGALVSALGLRGLDGADLAHRVSERLAAEAVVDPWESAALATLIDPVSARVTFQSGDERHAVAWRAVSRLGDGLDEGPRRPVIVVVDDLDACAPTVAWVRWRLAQRGSALGDVLIVATSRTPVAPDGPLAALAGRDDVQALPLGPLDPRESNDLVSDLLGLEGVLAEQVVQRAAGNPMFAVQLVGDWVQRGVLEVGATGFLLRAGVRADLPDDLHALWADRVRQVVDPVVLEALQVGALLGLEVPARLWADACGRVGVPAPDGALDRLLDAGLAQLTGDQLVFSHGMLRESLERSAREGSRWAAMHAACADARISAVERGPGFASLVARHLVEAGRRDEAIPWLLDAGDEGRFTSDPMTGLRVLDEAIGLLDAVDAAPDDARRVRAVISRGWCLLAVGDADGATGCAERVGADDPQRWAAARLLGGVGLRRRDPNGAILHLQRAWRTAPTPEDRATSKITLASALRRAGRLHESQGMFQEVIAATPGGKTWADAQYGLAATYWQLKQPEDTERTCVLAQAAFARIGDRFGEAACANLLGELYRARGDLVAARYQYDAAERYLTATGSSSAPIASFNSALVSWLAGDWVDAQWRLESVRRRAVEVRDPLVDVAASALLLDIFARNADPTAFAALLTHVTAAYRPAYAADGDLVDALISAAQGAAQQRWPEAASVARLAQNAAEALSDPGRLAKARALG